MEVIKGIPVAPGIVIGRALVVQEDVSRVSRRSIPAGQVDREVARLDRAIEEAQRELEHDRARAAETLGPEPAKIFEFHLGLLKDPSLVGPIRTAIGTDKITAASAVAEGFRKLVDQFRAMGSEVFRQKANDVLDLDRRVLDKLIGRPRDRLEAVDGPVIVIAHDYTPAQTASLDLDNVIGFALDAGGRTSHTSIIAAALGIPVVVGCQRVSAKVNDGDMVIIDGRGGMVVVRPDDDTIEEFQRGRRALTERAAGMREMAGKEAVTKDGVHVTLLGNVEFSREIKHLLASGGEGVGLFRTEFLYLTRGSDPSEEEMFEEYRLSLELLEGRPLTLRTVDLGADKYTQERAEEPERNPMLGLRSIRFCLQNIPMFRTQLRAVLRASAFGPLRIMFPLISTAMEIRQAKMIVRDVMEELDEEGVAYDAEVPIGIMIEVPSAALMASALARHVDFFSIGTNDLIQYTLAVDRGNERVANLYSGANPAVVQLVKAVLRAAKRFEVDASLCGEIAGEPVFTMLLIGLGLRTLSLVPSQIPDIKRVIRSVDTQQCERLARKVGSFDSERQVMRCLRQELDSVLPEGVDDWHTGSSE